MNQQVKNTLAALRRGQQVTVIYDGKFEHQRLRVTGKVVTVDHFWKHCRSTRSVSTFPRSTISKYNYSSSSDADELFTLNPWTFLLSVLLM